MDDVEIKLLHCLSSSTSKFAFVPQAPQLTVTTGVNGKEEQV